MGLERTVDEYLAATRLALAECWRVLRPDGVCFWNIGDSYANDEKWGGTTGGKHAAGLHGEPVGRMKRKTGLKPKDLMLIPERVGLLAQEPIEHVRMKDRIDRAWLAALTDGEGCIGISRTTSPHGSGDSFPPFLQIRMCDLEPLTKSVAITGYGKTSPLQNPPSKGGQRGSYHWRITGREAADIIAEIYPYLLVKRKQAVIAWNHQAIRESYHTKKGVRIPAEAVEKQIYCRALIQALNHHESIDLPDWMKEPKIKVEPGWYVRSRVIWHKPNCMPESVRDRPTVDYETVWMFTKAARYYWDAEAVKEKLESDPASWGRHSNKDPGLQAVSPRPMFGPGRNGRDGTEWGNGQSRNLRTVWSLPTQPYADAHYATFPPALPRRCILAATSPRACGVCQAPWERELERTFVGSYHDHSRDRVEYGLRQGGKGPANTWTPPRTIGWQPTCTHTDDQGEGKCIVLDPFCGSGTTVAVAVELGRAGIGFDLSYLYLRDHARKRLAGTTIGMAL